MTYTVFYSEYSEIFDKAEQKLCLTDTLYAILVKNGTISTQMRSSFYLRHYGISIRNAENGGEVIYEFINKSALTYFLSRFNSFDN